MGGILSEAWDADASCLGQPLHVDAATILPNTDTSWNEMGTKLQQPVG